MTDLATARLQTVRDHMALECVGDWDAVIATFEHPRYELYGTGRVFDGEAEVRGYFRASRTPFPDQANEIIALAADPAHDVVLVEFWLTGTHLGPLRLADRTVEPTGRSGSDKIVCERPYFDQGAVLRALDLA
jgi:SnoaL-like domain